MPVAVVGFIYMTLKHTLTRSNPSLSLKHLYSLLNKTNSRIILNSVGCHVNTTVDLVGDLIAKIAVVQMSGEDTQYYGWVDWHGSHDRSFIHRTMASGHWPIQADSNIELM